MNTHPLEMTTLADVAAIELRARALRAAYMRLMVDRLVARLRGTAATDTASDAATV